MTSSQALPVEFDPFCAEALGDPIAYQRWMREAGPVLVHRGYKHPLYALTRHADIRALWQDPASGSANYGQMPDFTEEPGLRNDPPEHTIFRNLINPYFSVAAVKTMAGFYEATANRLIDAMIADRSEGDFCANFSARYPITVAADLLGVDASKYDDFHHWSNEFTAGANGTDLPRMEAAQASMFAYFRDILARRRAQLAEDPARAPDDLIRHLVAAIHPEGRPYREDELLQLMMLLLLGGTDTTASLLGNCVMRLLQEPAQWRLLCERPELAEAAVEESLRFDPPVMATFRTSAKALNIAGVDIPAGVKIAAYYACANRDPEVWESPDSFRIDREPAKLRRHLSFGYGIHHCVGNHLARLDARIALQVIARRLPSLRANGQPAIRVLPFLRGVSNLPVRWD